MAEIFNIYCDESCHLEHDSIPVMVLGCVWCNKDKTKEIADRIRDIKLGFGLIDSSELHDTKRRPFEIKWSKVSKGKKDFYLRLVDYFFNDDDLHFRSIVIDKTKLDHEALHQTHDDWYYKMMFTLIEPIIDPEHSYRIFLDIKDTRSEIKRKNLERILRSARHDSSQRIIQCVQQIRSHESEILQIADFLMGAVGYHNRMRRGDLPKGTISLNHTKASIVRRIQQKSGKDLEHTTWLREAKFNILRWEPKEKYNVQISYSASAD